MILKARTKLACKIARIDPARFNEAVHFNKYACAPRTTPGSARIFYQDDIVALMIYGMLTDMGQSADSAGALACEALSKFRDRPEVETVTWVKSLVGFQHMMVGEIRADVNYAGLHEKAIWFTFNVKVFRAHVAECLEHEYSILGED